MIKIKELSVKITYEVGLSEVEMPEKIHQQLLEAYQNGRQIKMDTDAHEWLSANINEIDCMEWSAEIIEISE